MIPEVKHSFLEQTVEALNNYLSAATLFDAQFNELDRFLVVVKYYGGFLAALTDTVHPVMQPEELTLVLITQYLASPTFDKKFSAVALLKTKLEGYKNETESAKDEWRDILLRNGILKTLYITGYHAEVARKSEDLLVFVAPLLQPETVETLIVSAYGQSSEKGSVLAQCLKKSLGQFSHPVIKNILITLETKVPLAKIEKDGIELVLTIANTFSQPKISKFNSHPQSEQMVPIFADSILFLWSCLDEKSTVSNS